MVEKSMFFDKVVKLSRKCFPVSGVIEVTDRCNAGCGYCYIDDHVTSPQLNSEQLYYVIDKLAESGVMFLNITGGEPFLRSDINEILEHCFEKDFFALSIYSNGTVLEKRHVRLLRQYRHMIHPFRMTVFSHREELHDAYMKVPGSLRAIIAAGKTLIDNGIHVQLSIPYMDFNKKELSESMEYFVNLGFPIGANPQKLINDFNDSPEIRNMISEVFYNDVFSNNSCREASENENSDALCRGLNETVMIDICGNIHPCTTFRNFIVGSIFEELPLKEILSRNKQYMVLKNLSKKDLVCGTCEHNNICSPCIAQWHTLSGSFVQPHPQSCNMTKAYASWLSMRKTDEKALCCSI